MFLVFAIVLSPFSLGQLFLWQSWELTLTTSSERHLPYAIRSRSLALSWQTIKTSVDRSSLAWLSVLRSCCVRVHRIMARLVVVTGALLLGAVGLWAKCFEITFAMFKSNPLAWASFTSAIFMVSA